MKSWNLAICTDMYGAGKYNAKWNKVRERQISYDFTDMGNLRNKTNEQRGDKRNRETNQEAYSSL